MNFLEQRRQDKEDAKNRLEEAYNMKGHPKAVDSVPGPYRIRVV